MKRDNGQGVIVVVNEVGEKIYLCVNEESYYLGNGRIAEGASFDEKVNLRTLTSAL